MKLSQLLIVCVCAVLLSNYASAMTGKTFKSSLLFNAQAEIGGKSRDGGLHHRSVKREANIKRESVKAVRLVQCANGDFLAFCGDAGKLAAYRGELLASIASLSVKERVYATKAMKVSLVSDAQAETSEEGGAFAYTLVKASSAKNYVLFIPAFLEDFITETFEKNWVSGKVAFDECEPFFEKSERIETEAILLSVRESFDSDTQLVYCPDFSPVPVPVHGQAIKRYKEKKFFSPVAPHKALNYDAKSPVFSNEFTDEGQRIIHARSTSDYESTRRGSSVLHDVIANANLKECAEALSFCAKLEGFEFDFFAFRKSQSEKKRALSQIENGSLAREIANDIFAEKCFMSFDANLLAALDAVEETQNEVALCEKILKFQPRADKTATGWRELDAVIEREKFKGSLKAEINRLKAVEAVEAEKVKALSAFLKAIQKAIAAPKSQEARSEVNKRYAANVAAKSNESEKEAARAAARARKAAQRQRERAKKESEAATESHKMQDAITYDVQRERAEMSAANS